MGSATIQNTVLDVDEVRRAMRVQYHVTLGELIAELELADPAGLVDFDGEVSPGDIDVYAGNGEDIAFWRMDGEVTVSEFLVRCRDALGVSYTIGDTEAVAAADSPLWASESGWPSGRAVVDVETHIEGVTLRTKVVEAPPQ